MSTADGRPHPGPALGRAADAASLPAQPRHHRRVRATTANMLLVREERRISFPITQQIQVSSQAVIWRRRCHTPGPRGGTRPASRPRLLYPMTDCTLWWLWCYHRDVCVGNSPSSPRPARGQPANRHSGLYMLYSTARKRVHVSIHRRGGSAANLPVRLI